MAAANSFLFEERLRNEEKKQLALRKLDRPWMVTEKWLAHSPFLMGERSISEIIYPASAVDKIGPPDAFFTEGRYLGYRESDHAKPCARYFQPEPLPPQSHVAESLRSGPAPSEHVVPIIDAARRMS